MVLISPLTARASIPSQTTGVQAGADLGAMIMGRVLGVDPDDRTVQVSVLDSDPVWVPAVGAIYTVGGRVRLLRSPLDGGKLTACLGPLDWAQPITRGQIVSIDTDERLMTVTVFGTDHTLTYTSSTYDVGQFVHVLLSEGGFGRPFHVAGPDGESGGAAPGGGTGGVENPGQVQNRQVTIGPQWSGSWTGSRWDNWNQNRPDYGGRAALYQGQGYGSPSMSGLAVYGDQIVNLQAQSITRMIVHLERPSSGSGGGSGPAVLQGSPHGGATPGGGPAGTGATASTGIGRGTAVDIDLPSGMFDGFRTGALKGLALVGSDYLNLFGADRASAFALTIQYTAVR